eukprot:gene13443-15845_t
MEYLKRADVDEERVFSHIIQVLSDGGALDAAQHDKLANVLKEVISNERIKYLVVNVIIDHFKRDAMKSSDDWLGFLKVLFSTSIVDATERTELRALIVDLPPAVIGDVEDRNKSRVLLDLLADVNDAMSVDRRKMQEIKLFVEEVSSVLVDYIGNRKIEGADAHLLRTEMIAILLLNLNKVYRSKLLLQNLLTSRILPTQQSSRD